MKEKDILFGFSFYSLFSVWKIVGMTMTCDKHAVMNIMWYKTEMEQKSDRETRGDGGGGGGAEGEREFWALQYEFKRKTKKKEEEKAPCFGSNHGKGRRLPIPNIPGDEWENWNTQGKNPLARCKPYDINLDEGFTAIKAQENNNKREGRERHTHKNTLSHNRTCVYMY